MKKEEEYIIAAGQEPVEGENVDWVVHLSQAFPAFAHINYRIYFFGNLVSLVGTWLQNVAQGYLVYELTHSATWIGIIAALQTLPVLLFALFGGIIVDTFPTKRIVFFTQSVLMILAFVLAALTLTHLITPYHIAVLSFLLGICLALDMPARQTFMHKIVDKNALPSAISINAGTYNAARVIGPAFAGVLISIIGVGGAFVLNGLSFFAVLIALHFIRIKEEVRRSIMHPLAAIKEGLHYSFSHPLIRPLLLLTALHSIFGWSYVTVMPILAKDIFSQGASGLGYLQSSAGIGAVIAAIVVSATVQHFTVHKLIFGGSILFSLSMFLLTFSTSFVLGMMLLVGMGFGLLVLFSMINTTLQRNSQSYIRGRVLSIYTLMFIGMSVFGSLEIGYLTEHFGVMSALRINSIILLSLVVVMNNVEKSLKSI